MNMSIVSYDMKFKWIYYKMSDTKPVMVTFEISQILVIMQR